MKDYSFSVSRYPNSSLHLPLVAVMTLSDEAVTAGVAVGADILSIRITAGLPLPDTSPMTLAEYHPAFLNPTVTLSTDRQRVTGIRADNANGGQWNFWVFFQTFHQTPAGKVENVVKVLADSIQVETDYIPSATKPDGVFVSQFGGAWTAAGVGEPKNPWEFQGSLPVAIDPLALLLPNDVYVRLTLPDPPPFEVVRKQVRERIAKMSVEEVKRTYARVKAMKVFAEDLAKEFEKRMG